MNITLETKRLLIRPVVPTDAEAIFRWASDPLVTRYMVYTTHPNVEHTRAWLESRNIEDKDSYDLGITLKETGELIGMGGIEYHTDTDEWILGYNLRRDHWGEGIATEAMKAIIDHVRSRRKVRRIRGCFVVENTRSQNVMEKLGMHYLEDSICTKFDGTKLPAKTYVVDYEDF